MSSKVFLKINGNKPFRDLRAAGIDVEDREGHLYEELVAGQDMYSGDSILHWYGLRGLGLQPGATTPEIFAAAYEHDAMLVRPEIALQTLLQFPNPFKRSFLSGLFGNNVPFKSCLLGISPLDGDRVGDKYVVELSPNHFRFRRADDNLDWSDKEYWVFAKKMS